MDSEKEIIQNFIYHRDRLIKSLEEGEMDKELFLFRNALLVEKLSMRPFNPVDSIEKGLYNYHYYNVLAKQYNNLGNSTNGRKQKFNFNKRDNYYCEKDKSLEAMLELRNYKNVKAYFIHLHSTRLKNYIFEVVFTDKEYAIFHSKNIKILNKLKKNRVFSESPQKSLIDTYVNKP
ncbi:DUF6648 family protein [Lagierella sp.]|uniref:DUF6648 family protein n=1 Tax=Lagierella sp. TaxID=2849657 RepID=UPI00262ED818|nr:DUF6648 family protein [Lagierella sp.]